MSEETLFAEPTSSETPADVVDQTNESAQPSLTIPAEVVDLIGEGKKYATVEAALAALPHAQTHISRLEEENKEFRDKLMTNDKLDQVLSKLGTPSHEVEEEAQEQTASEQSISREELSQLVQQEIAQKERVTKEQANRNFVESKLREVYGEEVSTVFKTKASEVGMTPEQLTALAKVAPQAVISLVGIKSGSGQPTPTSEGVNLTSVGDVGEAPEHKDIMFGASTKELINEWKASAPQE